MTKTMAEVLAEHTYDRLHAVCSCSDFVQVGLKCDKQTHPEHVAEVLTAAGFGLVADAKAEALEEAVADFEDNIGINEFDEQARHEGRRWGHIEEAWEHQGPYMDWLRARAAELNRP